MAGVWQRAEVPSAPRSGSEIAVVHALAFSGDGRALFAALVRWSVRVLVCTVERAR